MIAHVFPTRLGEVVALGDDDALTALSFTDGRCPPFADLVAAPTGPLAAAEEQLCAYLDGARRGFDLPLRPTGTPFQHRVWAALAQIPYGTTRTYGDIAAELGTAPRAVGLANGRNPLSVVVPCHRLVGGSGALTGYAGGLQRKAALLTLEGSSSARRSDQNAAVPTSSGSQNRITR